MSRAETKFEDCATCKNMRKPWVCRGCDVGEMFEEMEAVQELDFSEEAEFGRRR